MNWKIDITNQFWFGRMTYAKWDENLLDTIQCIVDMKRWKQQKISIWIQVNGLRISVRMKAFFISILSIKSGGTGRKIVRYWYFQNSIIRIFFGIIKWHLLLTSRYMRHEWKICKHFVHFDKDLFFGKTSKAFISLVTHYYPKTLTIHFIWSFFDRNIRISNFEDIADGFG